MVCGLVGDVRPGSPGPREVEARQVVRHPIRQALARFYVHPRHLREHLPHHLRHHLRERLDRLAQILDHDVVKHGGVRRARKREHLPEERLRHQKLAALGVVAGKGGCRAVLRRGSPCRA